MEPKPAQVAGPSGALRAAYSTWGAAMAIGATDMALLALDVARQLSVERQKGGYR